MATIPGLQIVSETLLDVSAADYEDGSGFFFHATGAGDIKYLALNDTEAVTKTFEASALYNNPVLAKKIYSSGTTATGIYAGKTSSGIYAG